jgi:hypothetical protein
MCHQCRLTHGPCPAWCLTYWRPVLQGFSRGSSTYRGVTAHPSGRWESRIGIPGSKHVYLGLFNQEAAAAQVRASNQYCLSLKHQPASVPDPFEYRPSSMRV